MRGAHVLWMLLFSVGALLGILLFGSAAWGDLEASLFDAAIRGEAPLRGLKCPVFITATESGTVSLPLKNPLERPTIFTVRARITDGFVLLKREQTSRLSLGPGEEATLEWGVTPKDAAYGGHLILVRVYQFARYPLPSRDSSCGIWVIRAGYLTGVQILVFALLASLAAMVAGIGLWVRASRPLSRERRGIIYGMVALAGLVVIGIVAGLLGWWVLGIGLVAIIVLMVVAIAAYFANRTG